MMTMAIPILYNKGLYYIFHEYTIRENMRKVYSCLPNVSLYVDV